MLQNIHNYLKAWTEPLEQPKQWKRDMRFGMWNKRSLYRYGSLTTVARELAWYKLDLVGEQGGPVTVGDYTCCYGRGNENQRGTGLS